MRWATATFYISAGVLHLSTPASFLPIMPDFVPFPRQVVILTGLCEIAGGAALVSASLRRLAGAMLALYAICVFPANIKTCFRRRPRSGPSGQLALPRPKDGASAGLVWWTLFASGVVSWPFKPKGLSSPQPSEGDAKDAAGKQL